MVLAEAYNPQDYYNFLLKKECIGFNKEGIKLKSGRLSPYYANLRNLTAKTSDALELARYVLSFARTKNLLTGKEVFYGVPEGATKTGLFVQLLYDEEYSSDYILSDRNYSWLKINELKTRVLEILEQNKEIINKTNTIYGNPFSIARELSIMLAYYAFKNLNKDYNLVLGRKKPKTHGMPQDRYFVGLPKGNILLIAEDLTNTKEIEKQLSSTDKIENIYTLIIENTEKIQYTGKASRKLILIEDVTTTGNSVIKEIKQLQNQGIEIKAVIALFNRQEIREDGKTVEEIFNEQGVKYYAMANALDILPLALKEQNPHSSIKNKIKEYYSAYGANNKKLDF